jgi:hypothetical protein
MTKKADHACVARERRMPGTPPFHSQRNTPWVAGALAPHLQPRAVRPVSKTSGNGKHKHHWASKPSHKRNTPGDEPPTLPLPQVIRHFAHNHPALRLRPRAPRRTLSSIHSGTGHNAPTDKPPAPSARTRLQLPPP